MNNALNVQRKVKIVDITTLEYILMGVCIAMLAVISGLVRQLKLLRERKAEEVIALEKQFAFHETWTSAYLDKLGITYQNIH